VRREISGNIRSYQVWSLRSDFGSPIRLPIALIEQTVDRALIAGLYPSARDLRKIGRNRSLHAPTRANIPTSHYGSRRFRSKWNTRNWQRETGINCRSETPHHRHEADRKKPESARRLPKETGSKSKSDKLVCRYCGSDDLAPSFIRRRDRRCRKCFSKRYGSAAPARKAKVKK
jgi:hypothetical protein